MRPQLNPRLGTKVPFPLDSQDFSGIFRNSHKNAFLRVLLVPGKDSALQEYSKRTMEVLVSAEYFPHKLELWRFPYSFCMYAFLASMAHWGREVGSLTRTCRFKIKSNKWKK